jgi:hypothetical protein
MAKSYLVQEEDGTSRFTLENGSGFILLEESFGERAHVVGMDYASSAVVGGILSGGVVGEDYAQAAVVGGPLP